MPRKLNLKDEQLRDSFTPETEATYNDKRDRARYERGSEQMKEAQAAMKVLVDRVNSMSNNNMIALAFCREMARTHPTLQQSLVSQLLVGIQAYARWAKDNHLYDDRNRGFIQMADDLEELLDKHDLPFN